MNVVAGTDADPFTVLELSGAVVGTGNDSCTTPNNGYIALNYSDIGTGGACNFIPAAAGVNNFSINLSTPQGVTNINAFSPDELSADATTDYITQPLTGEFTV